LNGLKKRDEQFRQAGAQIVTISSDSVEELGEYRQKSSMPFVMLGDSGRDVIKQYDVYNSSERGGIAIPAVFIVDRAGVMRYSNVEGKYIRVRSKQLLKIVASL